MHEHITEWNLDKKWTERIQYLFGIKTNSDGTFRCIANNPGNFQTPKLLSKILQPHIDKYLNTLDPNYAPIHDPFNPKFLKSKFPKFKLNLDSKNAQWSRKYTYKYWQNYFITLATLQIFDQNPKLIQNLYDKGRYYNKFIKLLIHALLNIHKKEEKRRKKMKKMEI